MLVYIIIFISLIFSFTDDPKKNNSPLIKLLSKHLATYHQIAAKYVQTKPNHWGVIPVDDILSSFPKDFQKIKSLGKFVSRADGNGTVVTYMPETNDLSKFITLALAKELENPINFGAYNSNIKKVIARNYSQEKWLSVPSSINIFIPNNAPTYVSKN